MMGRSPPLGTSSWNGTRRRTGAGGGDVFVHHDSPVVARHPPQERMALPRGILAPELAEAVDEVGQPPPLVLEILLRGVDEVGSGRRFFVDALAPEDPLSDERGEDLPDLNLLARVAPRARLEGDGAGGQRLAAIHLSPLAGRVGAKLREPVEDGLPGAG